jgi:putative colanic acid biosynthesis UDP-glucose lipid carrier transferase
MCALETSGLVEGVIQGDVKSSSFVTPAARNLGRRLGRRRLRWTYGLINRVVIACDVMIILLSGSLLNACSGSQSTQISWRQCLLLAIIEVVVFVVVLHRSGYYRIEHYRKLLSSIAPLVPGMLCAWLAGAIYFDAFRDGMWTQELLWYWHAPQAIALIMSRQAARYLMARIDSHALMRRNAIVIGANSASQTILSRLLLDPLQSQYDIKGIFPDSLDEQQRGEICGVPIIGSLDKAGMFASNNQIDLVILALPLDRAVATVQQIEHLKWMTADVVIPMNEIQILPNFARLTTIADTLTLQVLNRPLVGSQALLKLVEDYVIATAALVLSSPILLLAAVAIRLDSSGPVIFRQERTGLNNEPFRIFKFRTMLLDESDDGSLGTRSPSNPRITRVGRFLRRWSIDELPQLLNVLRGEMSIVGPRPYVPNMLVESETIRSAVRNYAFRYRVMPGITGLAQVSGMRSNALRSLENSSRSVEYDLEYIMRWSIWLDLQIIMRTALTALSGPHVF